jgi:hypothetical protein
MSRPRTERPISRRTALAALLGGGTAALAGCAGEHFSFLGYTTRPNYDPEIRTVFVPVFKTRFLETGPYRGVEFTLTRAVIDAIELRTPMKVVSDPAGADTELQGAVISVTKLEVNRTPFNEARELQYLLSLEIVWHDLRTGHEGKILTNPRRRDPSAPPTDIPFDPAATPLQITPDKPQPSVLTSVGRAVPELGESTTTGLQMAINRMAVLVTQAMEEQW